ncbi:hypothetical protein [Xanthomonas euvesicatoria]|uniref:hypothetical protein n=1 Tax=Xanthomonas euvesicatoria TaxID=456327 RepID=UPI003557CB08
MNLTTVVSSILDEMKRYTTFQVAVFWLDEQGDRDRMCSDLTALFIGSRVVPHVLRKPLFSDPNSWAADAMSVIDGLKEKVQAASEGCDRDAPLGLVIIARTKLRVAQTSSPATAPSWLSAYGGREIMVVARDVHSIGCCSLEAPEAAVDAVKSSLYELELGLLKVAKYLASREKHHGQKLWGEVLKERSKLDRKAQFFDTWAEGVGTVSDAPSYRPSLKFGWSIVSAMWDTFLRSSPSQLLTRSEAFVEFFEIEADWMPAQPLPSALLPILFRGSEDRERGANLVAGRNLVLTVGLACQLVTAAAHADQYGKVNAVALEAISKDLRMVLSAVEQRTAWLAQAALEMQAEEPRLPA